MAHCQIGYLGGISAKTSKLKTDSESIVLTQYTALHIISKEEFSLGILMSFYVLYMVFYMYTPVL